MGYFQASDGGGERKSFPEFFVIFPRFSFPRFHFHFPNILLGLQDIFCNITFPLFWYTNSDIFTRRVGVVVILEPWSKVMVRGVGVVRQRMGVL